MIEYEERTAGLLRTTLSNASWSQFAKAPEWWFAMTGVPILTAAVLHPFAAPLPWGSFSTKEHAGLLAWFAIAALVVNLTVAVHHFQCLRSAWRKQKHEISREGHTPLEPDPKVEVPHRRLVFSYVAVGTWFLMAPAILGTAVVLLLRAS